MTKDWEAHKHEIIRLYSRGHILDDVQRILELRHGFRASSRAYKMKLISWKIRKNRPAKSGERIKSEEKTPPPSPIEVQRHGRKSSFSQGIFNDSQSDDHPDSPIGVHTHSRKPSFSQGIFDEVPNRSGFELLDAPETVLASPPLMSQGPVEFSPMEMLSSTSTVPNFLTTSTALQEPPSGSLPAPIVNSSFRFFSNLPEVESLERLVRSTSLHAHAIYILLHNWKPYHPKNIYMKCAQHILDNTSSCHSILNYIYTWDRKISLFDIICYGNFSSNERHLLISALLSADLKFAHPLKGQYSSWAVTWRKASQQWNWEEAKSILKTRNPDWEIQRAALSVMCEYFQMMEPLFSS